MRAKFLKFDENRRPAYWGTWRKTSQSVGPRRPFGKEVLIESLTYPYLSNKNRFILRAGNF